MSKLKATLSRFAVSLAGFSFTYFKLPDGSKVIERPTCGSGTAELAKAGTPWVIEAHSKAEAKGIFSEIMGITEGRGVDGEIAGTDRAFTIVLLDEG